MAGRNKQGKVISYDDTAKKDIPFVLGWKFLSLQLISVLV